MFFVANIRKYIVRRQVTVAAGSKERNVFGSSNAGIVVSNPVQGMYVCVRLFCVCVVLCR
jgi:hypothetical protein